MRRLPPLNALKAFESAARQMSFTKAGQELNVTHGAISRQVAHLEAWLGVALFQRARSRLELTSAGKRLYGEVGAALDRISLAALQLAQTPNQDVLTVSAPPTFTLRWLIPRLSTFQRNHLGVDIRLTASLAPVDFVRENAAIAIRAGAQPLPGVTSRAFLAEKIVVVCHPDLLERQALNNAHDLGGHTLLNYATAPYTWQEWLQAVDATEVKPAAELNFEQMYFTLQAALEGLGVALIPYFLVVDDIASGRLCTPLGLLGVRERRYYANSNPARKATPGQLAFLAWLEREGRSTRQLCDQLMMESNRS